MQVSKQKQAALNKTKVLDSIYGNGYVLPQKVSLIMSPLLAIQSPGNKTDFYIKVQLEIQGIEITIELRHLSQ